MVKFSYWKNNTKKNRRGFMMLITMKCKNSMKCGKKCSKIFNLKSNNYIPNSSKSRKETRKRHKKIFPSKLVE